MYNSTSSAYDYMNTFLEKPPVSALYDPLFVIAFKTS